MLDANIIQNNNTTGRRPRVYETLTKPVRASLRKATIGHGNMLACELATGKDRGMILRAIAGGRLMPENAEILRNYVANYNPSSL